MNNYSNISNNNKSKVIYPHINPKKQFKEVNSIYCYDFHISDYRGSSSNKEFVAYTNFLMNFAHTNSTSNLVTYETDGKEQFRQTFTRSGNGNSALFNFKYIPVEEKSKIDRFLVMSGWHNNENDKNNIDDTFRKRKIDKFGYVFEGCLNDEKIFVGGKKEFLVHYCSKFPSNSYCKKMIEKAGAQNVQNKMKKVFDNPDTADKVINEFIKLFDESSKI